MLRKGHGGLYKAPTKEERRKRKAKSRERDQIKFIDLRFERGKVVGFRKGKRQDSTLNIRSSDKQHVLWSELSLVGESLWIR